jgi:hypothetical protein
MIGKVLQLLRRKIEGAVHGAALEQEEWRRDCAPREGVVWKIETTSDGKSILFQPCGMRSFHPKDIEHLYCGRCHRFFGRKLGG